MQQGNPSLHRKAGQYAMLIAAGGTVALLILATLALYYDAVPMQGRLVGTKIRTEYAPFAVYRVEEVFELTGAASVQRCYLTMTEVYHLRATAEGGASTVKLGTTRFLHAAKMKMSQEASCISKTDYAVLLILCTSLGLVVVVFMVHGVSTMLYWRSRFAYVPLPHTV